MKTKTGNLKANEVIDALGGNIALAKHFNVSLPAISYWRRAGVPKLQYQLLLLTKKKQMQAIEDHHLCVKQE